MARTIDNLGVEISTRYAEDKELFDETLIKEARTIPSQTNVAVTLPSKPNEFEALFDLGKSKVRWAIFLAPPNYYAYRRRLFSEQLIPRLGTPDMQEAQLVRIGAISEEEKKKNQQPPPHTEDEVEKEKKILSKLLENIHLLDQLLIDINSRRSQYQKG